MIHRLDFALRRWRLYKRLLMTFAVVNVFTVAAGLVIGIHYVNYDLITAQELIAIGLITLLFGIILPLVVMARITSTIRALRQEIQRSVFDFLRNWRQTEQDFAAQDGAFKNPEFWLQIALLCGQFFGQASSNPAAQMAGEIALTIRNELKKNRSPAT